MRVIFCFISCFLLFTRIQAQENFGSLPNNETGLNINALASNFLTIQDETLDLASLENLIFFKTGKKKWKFRTAVNYGISNSILENSEVSNSFVLLKLGIENKKQLTKSWVFHSGFEAFGLRSSSKVSTNDFFFGEFTSNTINSRVGVSFIYGVQVLLSKHIALGTEGYFFLSYAESKVVQENVNFSDSSSSDNLNFGITLPKSLLLSYYF